MTGYMGAQRMANQMDGFGWQTDIEQIDQCLTKAGTKLMRIVLIVKIIIKYHILFTGGTFAIAVV